MTEFTPARLAELRAVAEAATPGEWRHWNPSTGPSHVTIGGKVAFESLQSATSFADDEAIPHWADARHIATFDPPTALALIAALEAKTAEVEAAERQLAIRAEDSIARRLAMATVAEVGTETAAGDTADTLAELLIEAELERDEARELYKGACEAEDALNSVNDALINRAEKAEAALERVRALHQRRLGSADDWDTCTCDYDEYPCPTIKAIEGADDV